MNRYRLIIKEIKLISYEINAYKIDDALARYQDWAEQKRKSDENSQLIKIELIEEK